LWRIAGAAFADASAAPANPSPAPAFPPSRLPIGLVLAVLAVIAALSVYSLWAARLRWGIGERVS
jgi:hypothetical protein